MYNFKTKFVFIFMLFLLTASLLCCTKEFSNEGGIAAVYTLNKVQNHCLNTVINGNYWVGVAADSSNYIQLQAHVSVAGSYALQTQTINGIFFKVKGIFSDTGNFIITLKANGKPLADGIFSYETPGNNGCTFDIAITKKPVVNAVFKFAGEPNNCTGPVIKGDYISGRSVSNLNTVTLQVLVDSIGFYTINTDTVHGMSFSGSGTFTKLGLQTITLAAAGTPTLAGIQSFIPIGIIYSCKFSVNVFNAEPLATYVLESGGDINTSCLFQVKGDYLINTPVNLSNTVSVRVYVTVPGNFTISTEIVNGIQFNYTGAFSATGSQPVVLNAYGTPMASGIFKFIPSIIGPHPIGGESCGVLITFN